VETFTTKASANSAKKPETDIDNLFGKNYETYVNALYNFAFRLTQHDADAADLVQDTFLKAIKYEDKYEKGTNLKAWLFRILKNTFINEYNRKARHQPFIDFDEIRPYHENELLETNAPAMYIDLRQEIFDDMLGDEVSIALNSLSQNEQTIILLDVEDFSYEEMSDILQIPIGTVRSRLFRARNNLKAKLYDYALSMGFKDKRP
jgi:RNA polymerase sigma factor (sigma-70 family)